MRRVLFAAFAVFAMTCLGCGSKPQEPQTLAEARERLPEDERADFDKSAKAMGVTDANFGEFMSEMKEAGKRIEAHAAELRQRKKEHEDALVKLRALSISGVSLEPRDGSPLSTNTIHFTAKNGLSSAVARVYIKAEYKTPGRAVPWAVGEFQAGIPGGLEPGESRKIKHSASFDALGSAKVQPGAVLSLQVVRADGADGKSLFAEPLSDFEEAMASKD